MHYETCERCLRIVEATNAYMSSECSSAQLADVVILNKHVHVEESAKVPAK